MKIDKKKIRLIKLCTGDLIIGEVDEPIESENTKI